MVKKKTELLTVTGKLHIWSPVRFGGGGNLPFHAKSFLRIHIYNQVNVRLMLGNPYHTEYLRLYYECSRGLLIAVL